MCIMLNILIYNAVRPGPNIPLNLPIIEIIILHISTPLFKRKLPIILRQKLMQMKHEYDVPECSYILANKCWIICNFLFLVQK